VRREVTARAVAIAISSVIAACTTEAPTSLAPEASPQRVAPSAPPSIERAPVPSVITEPAPLPPPLPPAPARPSACNAPSVVALAGQDDARRLEPFARCTPYEPMFAPWDDEQSAAGQCGQPGVYARKVDVQKILDAALDFDSATLDHVRAVFTDGRAKGRRADVFGLVGDSITIDHSFLRPFAAASPERVTLAPAVREALRVDASRTIIDLFRGVPAAGAHGASGSTSYDSFRAPRAAKNGTRVKWAISYNGAMHATPVEDLVSTLAPAYAVVMFGTNDAEWYSLPLDQIAREFGRELRTLVTLLESRGVIPILTTIPKHMRDRRFADCPTTGNGPSNVRYAVQTNVVSAAIAEVACETHLPLIDYRWALDPLLDHGVAADGVHPSLYYRGGGVLDESGLQCGFNVRNLVTLRMLKMVHAAVAP
jgi:lysophospholipase L1-like esterase